MMETIQQSESKHPAIIAGVDFSEASHHALEEAVRIANREEAKLIICHFLYDEEMAHLTKWAGLTPEAIVAGRKSHLLSWIDELETDELQLDLRIEVGHPYAELTKTARTEKAKLLVLGAQGESHKTHSHQIGSVARACLRHAPCEVLLLRKEQATRFHTVLAAIDFSENSKEAVHQAVEIAHVDQAELHVIHIFAPAWKYYGERADVAGEVENYKAEIRKEFRDFIYPELAEARHLPLHFDVRESLSAYHGILAHAEEVGADLIVVGLQGRSAQHSPSLGSTAERIIEKSTCSVLSVPPDRNPAQPNLGL
ncbi:MAG: universal stress protein [Verrucomicrobiales bacterium]|nr:universal stress protein [Verrucomicrobiales bacterium]